MKLLKKIKQVFNRYYNAFLCRGGADLIIYSLYYSFCKKIFKRKSKTLSKDQISNFKENKVLIIPSFINAQKVDSYVQDFDKKIQDNQFTSKYIKFKSKPSLLKRNINRFLLNASISYSFPEKYFQQVKMITNPILNITGLRKELSSKILPVLNNLMNTNSNIYKVQLFETSNQNKKETKNVNGELHRDGDIWTSIKCIIYLTDVDKNNGPFCYLNTNSNLISVEAKKGTAIFFKSSQLSHKGSNTLLNRRLAISFTAYPHFKNEITNFDYCPEFTRSTIPFFPVSKKLRI